MIVMLNRATKDTFSCLKIIFQVLKIRKKEYMEMIEKFYLETWKILPTARFSDIKFCESRDKLSRGLTMITSAKGNVNLRVRTSLGKSASWLIW